MYLDYEFYSTVYFGKVKEEEFPTLEIKASGILNYHTFNRISKATQNVKFAMCELIDLISKEEANDGKEISSEKVGTYSVAYSDKHSKSVNNKQKDIIRRYINPNLLYRGV